MKGRSTKEVPAEINPQKQEMEKKFMAFTSGKRFTEYRSVRHLLKRKLHEDKDRHM